MRIPQDKVAQIREANPIEEVIAGYISLKKAGKNFKALCPFHSERTPSFFVSPEKGLYHCFGCGKSGNIITFIMEYSKLSFLEAVQFLGERVGIQIKFEKPKNEHLYKINKFVAELFHSILLAPEGLPARRWIEHRGIQKETVNEFMLGYAPSESIVYRSAKSKGIKLEDLETLGLVTKLENGRYRDSFRRKIIFPIRDRWDKVIGFGTRVLDQSEPKYINSPESPVFKKGKSLYGLYEAKNQLREKTILVEGYTDVLTLHQYGIKNVVASLGTSLTEEQARLLKLHTQKVILIYDGDIAGQNAAERAINILLEAGLDISILVLPKGEDPDSFIREKGNFDFSKVQNFVDFKFKESKSIEEKTELVKSFQQTLIKISDSVKKELWADYISKKIGIKKELLLITQPLSPTRLTARQVKTVSAPTKNLEDLEVELLAFASSNIASRKLLLENSFNFSSPELRPLAVLMLKETGPSEILNSITDERMRENFTKITFLENIDSEKMTLDYLKRINELRARKRMREIHEIIREGKETPELLDEYQKLATIKAKKD
ncbi:DNA primase [candidate division WOR-3 bacterium]|nr:DNA primase [candidate division WOR-3 bacterium]